MGYSYSMLNTANMCKKKYKYIFVDHIIPDSPHSIDLHFGTALHTAIENVLEGGEGHDVFDMYWTSVEYEKMDVGRFDYEYLSEAGYQFIRKFKKMHLKKIKPIDIEKRLYGKLGDIELEGTPDLIGEIDGVLTLADWKTSGYNYPADKILVNEQMYLYSYLYYLNTGKYPEQIIYYVFNKGTLSIQVLKKKLNLKRLDDILENIRIQCEDLEERKEYPKNSNSCFMGKRKCEFFDKCWKETYKDDE